MDYIATNKLLDLTGKRAVVTGGAAGIGLGISRRLAEAGALVVIADISSDNLATATSTFTTLGLTANYVKTDVSNPQDIQSLCQHAIDSLGGIDIWVNNAGIFPMTPVMNMDVSEFEKVININLKSVFMATQTAAKQMITQGQGGKIINITSIDALHPSMVGLAHYDASKHGVWGFTKNTALELAPHNIQINAVAPGGIITPGIGAKDGKLPPQSASLAATIPMGRLGDADEIGKVVLFLASDMASYLTGTQIVADGGKLLT